MPTVPESLIVALFRLTRRNRIWVNTAAAEAHLADRLLRPEPYGPPRRVPRQVSITIGRHRGWPVYTITPTGTAPGGTVLYAHGGGWVNEIAVQHWQLCMQIAAQAATTVVVPIYPLIPLGTAAEVIAGFSELAVTAAAAGPLVLAGDSAGGQIALSTALALRDGHGITAQRTILIAPGLDATLSNPDLAAAEALDPWLGQPGIRVFVERWRGELAMTDPTVSPIFGELAGLGPITTFSGTHDLLNPDARLLVRKLTAAGVENDYHEREGLIHVYPLLPTAPGAEARAVIVDRVRAAVSPS